MKHLGFKQKLCIAGWLLGAALLAGVNGYAFMAMEKAPPDGGDPVNLRALQSQLSLLESLLAANQGHLGDAERLQAFFAAYRQSKSPASLETGEEKAGQAGVLPGLAGIMQRVDGRGRPYYLAVMDGKVYAEKDEVRIFRVGSITAEGVVLQRAGMRWFLPSPQPYYTSDQGR